jgi:hypothetical protein
MTRAAALDDIKQSRKRPIVREGPLCFDIVVKSAIYRRLEQIPADM